MKDRYFKFKRSAHGKSSPGARNARVRRKVAREDATLENIVDAVMDEYHDALAELAKR